VMKKESKRSMEIQPRGTNSYMAPDLLSGKVTEKADIFSSLDGIHFLPVDKNVYLRVQSFINEN